MDSKLLAGLGLMRIINLNQINADTILMIVSSLSLLQFLVLWIRGSVFIDSVRLEGWKGKLPLYIIKCPTHGYQLTYPNGHSESLVCPKCVKSRLG